MCVCLCVCIDWLVSLWSVLLTGLQWMSSSSTPTVYRIQGRNPTWEPNPEPSCNVFLAYRPASIKVSYPIMRLYSSMHSRLHLNTLIGQCKSVVD